MLFLTLDTFSKTGGIQKVCRTLAYTLSAIAKSTAGNFSTFKMHSLYDNGCDARYVDAKQFMGFNGSKIRFLISAVINGLEAKTIIISHINLISIALVIKVFKRKTQIIMLAHGTEVWRKIPLWKRWVVQRHVKVWAVSSYTKRIIEREHNICPANIEVLNNALDPFFYIPEKFEKPQQLLKRYGLHKDQPILLSITRISKHETEKGYDEVIKLIPQLIHEFPSLHYLLCGKSDVNEKHRLASLIKKENLEQYVSLIDFINEDELTAHFLLADTFILPSKKEGFGLVFIEAAACGCKTISGNIDGSTDAMLNGALGIMVNPNNPDEIKKGIIKSLKKRHNHQTAWSIQTKCLANFSHQQYLQRTRYLLSKTLKNR
nr:glycosyltransferase family 4 protein [uncultured Pedobacter sp.]